MFQCGINITSNAYFKMNNIPSEPFITVLTLACLQHNAGGPDGIGTSEQVIDQLEAIHCSIDHLLHCLSTFDQHGQATLVPRTYKAVPATELPTDPSEAAETNCFTLQDQQKL